MSDDARSTFSWLNDLFDECEAARVSAVKQFRHDVTGLALTCQLAPDLSGRVNASDERAEFDVLRRMPDGSKAQLHVWLSEGEAELKVQIRDPVLTGGHFRLMQVDVRDGPAYSRVMSAVRHALLGEPPAPPGRAKPKPHVDSDDADDTSQVRASKTKPPREYSVRGIGYGMVRGQLTLGAAQRLARECHDDSKGKVTYHVWHEPTPRIVNTFPARRDEEDDE